MMNVREIRLTNFTTYSAVTLRLPPTGIVTLTGPNGGGKSSIVEGVAWAGWGKTLRDTPPYRDKTEKRPCVASVVCDGLVVMRTRAKATSLQWGLLDDGTETGAILDTLHRLGKMPAGNFTAVNQFENTTKAQEALEAVIGSFDVWRRSRAFSSHDAAHFTLATDGERKRLLEAAQGLTRFDPALEACRADLKKAQAAVQHWSVKKGELELRKNGEERRLREAKEGLAEMGPAPEEKKASVGAPMAAFDEELREVAGDLFAARQSLRAADQGAATLEATAAGLLATLARLREGACPTCTQPITAALRGSLKAEAEAAQAQATDDREAATGERERCEGLIKELEAERSALEKRHAERAAELRAEEEAKTAAARHTSTRERFTRIITEATAGTKKIEGEWQDADDEWACAMNDRLELEACELVLGLRGVRANILGRSLAGIEAVANAWLPRMLLDGDRKIAVRLRSYSEKKTGGTADAISLAIDGVGGGLGYRASSGGERRRIDVGLLLALAEVAAASAGSRTGTLFFDEVFDALDSGGKEAVASVLQELSEDRCVVVVTHSDELQSLLPAVKRVRIANGALTE